MMRNLGKIFVFSLLFYLVSVFLTRWCNSPVRDFWSKALYSLPWDTLPGDWEGKHNVEIQLGALSQKSVAELLESNPDNFNGSHLVNPSKSDPFKALQTDYLVIRFKNTNRTAWGDIKCSLSCFRYPIVMHIFAPGFMKEYSNIIIPYPATDNESQAPCAISLKWKNFWES